MLRKPRGSDFDSDEDEDDDEAEYQMPKNVTGQVRSAPLSDMQESERVGNRLTLVRI